MTESRQNYIHQLRNIFPNLEIQEDLPKLDHILRTDGKKLLIIDDLYFEAINSKEFLNLTIHGSSHGNCSYFLTTQNIFHQGKYQKSIQRQWTDVFTFPGLGDYQVLGFLSKQIFNDRSFLMDCVKWLKKNFKKQYERCLWISMNVQQHDMEDDFRVRANFLSKPVLLFKQKDIK